MGEQEQEQERVTRESRPVRLWVDRISRIGIGQGLAWWQRAQRQAKSLIRARERENGLSSSLLSKVCPNR